MKTLQHRRKRGVTGVMLPQPSALRRAFWCRRPSLGSLVLLGLAAAAVAKAGLLIGDLVPAVAAGSPRVGQEPVALDRRDVPAPGSVPEPAAGPPGAADGTPDLSEGAPKALRERQALLPSVDEATPSELRVLEELAARRRALDEQARELDLRRLLIETAETQLQDRLQELEQLQSEIETLVEQHDAEEEAKLAQLVKIYETMKPKAAAEIFDRLEMEVLIEVVSRMREANSSDVLGRMDPARARALTAELANRRHVSATLP